MSNASQVTSYNPWAPASPYLTDIMGQAQGLYGSTAPSYANPASNFGYGQLTGALGGAINGTNGLGSLSSSLNPRVGSAISSQLSGTPDYSAVQNALNAANTQTWNSFNNTELPQLNQRASFLGNPSGAIKDLNWATSQIGNNMDLNAQQAYLGQYDNALTRQANAAGLGANLAQSAGSQSLQGASLFPSISTLPQQNLANYANIVGNTAGRYGTNTATMTPGSAGTAANIIGGLTAGAGLYNTLFPQNGSGAGNALLGGLGKLFGGGATQSASTSTNQQQIDSFLASLNGSNNGFMNTDLSNLNFGGYPSNGYTGGQPSDINVMNTNFGNLSPSDLFGTGSGYPYTDQSSLYGQNFNGAGGQAATNTQSTNSDGVSAGAVLGAASGALGIANGIMSGKPTGYASAGLGAAKLGASNNAFGSNSGAVNSAAGTGLNALGIYSGIKQGGVAGDTSAAVNAAQLGSRLGAFGNASGAIGTAAGYAAAPLALYSAVNNYKSGATVSDAMNGAQAGAAIGSIIPGIGTVVGGVVGGAVGAIASAFGPGAKDPETVGVQKLLDTVGAHPAQSSTITSAVQNPYVAMAGLFDRHESTLPMYAQYGRMGEQKFTNDMVGKINQAVAANPSLKNDPQAMYSQVISPWVNSMGKGWSNVGDTYKQTTQGLMQQMVTQYMNGTAAQNWQSIGGGSPFANIYQGSSFNGVTEPSTISMMSGKKAAISSRY